MIVGLAVRDAQVNMRQNAESKLRILVEDLARILVRWPEVGSHELPIGAGPLNVFAGPLLVRTGPGPAEVTPGNPSLAAEVRTPWPSPRERFSRTGSRTQYVWRATVAPIHPRPAHAATTPRDPPDGRGRHAAAIDRRASRKDSRRHDGLPQPSTCRSPGIAAEPERDLRSRPPYLRTRVSRRLPTGMVPGSLRSPGRRCYAQPLWCSRRRPRDAGKHNASTEQRELMGMRGRANIRTWTGVTS